MIDRISQSIGNYRLVRLLGQGGFADVYLGEHIHLNTYAAIKVLRTQLAEDSVENFRAEARTLAHLKHPNIVQVLDFGVDGMTPYLVMEYAPNGTLRQRHARGKQVPIDVVVKYVKQIASALQFAHNQKLIHRDIKPENMLVGEQGQILLSDFGIAVMTASARAADPAQADANWNPAGTVAYMAPEQIQGKTVPASDQYALAIVVYEWLTGATPFNGPYMEVAAQQISAPPPSLREKTPSLPPDVEQVVLTALNKDPQRRFGRIEAFAMALEQAAQSAAAAPSPTSTVIQPNKSSEVSAMEASLVGPFGRTMLGSTKVTIGRAPDNMLVLNDPKTSSHHAEIRPEGQYYSLVDLGSTNGTFVNEQQVYSGVPRMLQPGDVLRIGDTKFTFEAAAPQGAAYSDGSTVRATPPPPPGAASGFAGNTSYGSPPLYPGAQPYQETIPAPSSYASPQPSETQMPTYIPSSYGQPGQQPSYTPQQYGSPSAQQPAYTPQQQPAYTPQQQPAYTPQQQPAYTPPAPAYNPPPAQQPKRSPARAIILAVIALVIILGGVLGYVFIHNNQVAQNNSNATATANTQAHNNATATAQAVAQATAHANATATALVTSHYPPFTNLAFNDALTSGSDSQWSSGSACKAGTTGYQVSIAQLGYFEHCTQLQSNFSDFAFQVDMTIQSGDCGGLVFREQDNNNFYVLLVCSDGTYDLGLFQNGKAEWANDLTQRPSSAAINKGTGQMNVVAVVVQGSTFNLYVNGSSKSVDTFTDSNNTFSQGEIGVVANDFTNPTSVIYTNAVVWTQ